MKIDIHTNFSSEFVSQSLNSKQTAFGETFLFQAVFNVLMAFLLLMLLIQKSVLKENDLEPIQSKLCQCQDFINPDTVLSVPSPENLDSFKTYLVLVRSSTFAP